MFGLETIRTMNANAVPAQPKPATANSVFTVIWQGVNFIVTNKGEEEEAQTHITEVTPDQYGYVDIPTYNEIWGAIACGEQFDGGNPFDRIDVIAVLEGGVIQVETEDRTDE